MKTKTVRRLLSSLLLFVLVILLMSLNSRKDGIDRQISKKLFRKEPESALRTEQVIIPEEISELPNVIVILVGLRQYSNPDSFS